ncbi:MAG TPA: hypothetical protein VE397_08980 [Stellaceae bacterium]|nr:hypothetical protein [Stellaceae bacterium]
MDVAEIPLIDAGPDGSAGLVRADLDGGRALLEGALATHPALPLAARIGDTLARRWLARGRNPYGDEIRRSAEMIGRPGVFFLNLVYEFACTTGAGPDPKTAGMRMIRVLDWGLSGIGRHLVLARHETRHGPYYAAAWPGYAGVLTAMAPGRFAAAINQAPRPPVLGLDLVDAAIGPWRMLRRPEALPATHLLRRVFEQAADFAEARAMLAESVSLAAPAIFTLSGVEAGQCAVVEAFERERRVTGPAADGHITVANAWLSPDLPGGPRACRGAGELTPIEDSTARAAALGRLLSGPFAGAQDIAPPVLNRSTVLVSVMNARQGTLALEALDPQGPGELPRVVARRLLAA